MKELLNKTRLFIRHSNFVKNSFWGIVGRVLETLFLTLFFVIISRKFAIFDFAQFLIASNIYQLVVGFSSMGLGNWFIREIVRESNKSEFINRFFKIQIGLGLLFYFLNIGLVFILYQDRNIRLLCLILGTNIIFDNIIFAIRSLNIAQSQQKKSAIIMALDGFAKLFLSCLLYIFPFSIIKLAVLLVVARLFTVNIFLQIGTSTKINFSSLWHFKISYYDIKKNVFSNWRFVVIVGVSLIFWRSATIIISKFLTLDDVANYEIAYKIFSVFLILPMIASTTIYPQFVKYFANNEYDAIKAFYEKAFIGFAILCMLCYAFIQSFADVIIPFIFGKKYFLASSCLKEMFLTFLVFPTALLQANLLVAIKLEKKDMYFNIIALAVNFISCFIGLYFYKSLSVINYSIFGAFCLFHIIQNRLLNKLKLTSFKNSFVFYLVVPLFVFTYQFAIHIFNTTIAFIIFSFIIIGLLTFYVYYNYNGWSSPICKTIYSESEP